MKRRTIASLLITALTVSMLVSGCGTKQNDTEKNSEVVSGTETENVSEMETEKETETQASSETESETQVATNDNTEKESEKEDETKPAHSCDFSALKNDANNHWYACSCGKTANSSAHGYTDEYDADCNVCGYKRNVPEKPVHTCNFATLKTDANNHWYACSCGNTSGKGGHGYDDEYDASCNTCGYTRSVPEKPVEPTPSEDEGINFTGGTINLPNLGVNISKLPSFNHVGIKDDGSKNDNWWTGTSPESANVGMNEIYFSCDSIAQALLDKGVIGTDSSAFTVSRNNIEWRYENGYAGADFKLTRDVGNGYYILEINRSLKDDPWGVLKLENYNKDIVKALCSFVSSQPETLANAIYETIYGDYVIPKNAWGNVADCKAYADVDASYKNHYVFKIKAK